MTIDCQLTSIQGDFCKTTIETTCKAPQKAGFFGDPAAINFLPRSRNISNNNINNISQQQLREQRTAKQIVRTDVR